MLRGNRGNVLLMELLFVLLLLMLSATVLMELFGAAHGLSVAAGVKNDALFQAQNLAAELAAAEDEQALKALTVDRDFGGFTLETGCSAGDAGAGTLYSGEIRAVRDGEALLGLPWARYFPAEVEP